MTAFNQHMYFLDREGIKERIQEIIDFNFKVLNNKKYEYKYNENVQPPPVAEKIIQQAVMALTRSDIFNPQEPQVNDQQLKHLCCIGFHLLSHILLKWGNGINDYTLILILPTIDSSYNMIVTIHYEMARFLSAISKLLTKDLPEDIFNLDPMHHNIDYNIFNADDLLIAHNLLYASYVCVPSSIKNYDDLMKHFVRPRNSFYSLSFKEAFERIINVACMYYNIDGVCFTLISKGDMMSAVFYRPEQENILLHVLFNQYRLHIESCKSAVLLEELELALHRDEHD